jgi:transcriptional regulator with XRE-family HTH domain
MSTALADHLEQEGITHAEFARRLGVTDSAVWRWAHGERSPGLKLAFAIEKETGGKVSAVSWFSKKRSARVA